MLNRLFSILFCALLALCAQAETIILRTGARVSGEIVMQNEEVVILRDKSGARFQFPRAEIVEIQADEKPVEQAPEQEEQTIKASKKASILLELAGGAAFIPGTVTGGAASVDLLVGSHHIGNRHLFAGAGIGYHGLFFSEEKYNFLPIQAVLRMPLMEQKHAPVFGIAVGYGVALSKDYLGGIYAGLDLGYKCQLNEKTAIALVLFAQFQQARITQTETIDGNAFTNRTGCYLVTSGLKFGLYF